ncbi:MAG: thioredoxin [Bacteroidota bacterium]
MNIAEVKAQDIVNGVTILADKNFDKTIKKDIVLVDFWATWCGPCRLQSPIIDQIAEEIGQKALICKMDVDENGKTANRFNVQYIPTILIFRDGVLIKRFTGAQEKQTLLDAIDEVAK